MFPSGRLEKVEANKFSVLSDRSMDAAIVEKECIYILFRDPDEFKLKLLFCALKEPISWDADGIYDALKRAFSDKNAGNLLKNVVFFSSDRTDVNSSLNAGIMLSSKNCAAGWYLFVCPIG